MTNFSKYKCDFIVGSVLKESLNKSVYSAFLKRQVSQAYGSFKEEVIIIKINKKCEKEINLLMTLKHQGIAKVLMMWEEKEYLIIIQEKILGLSLYEYIDLNKNLPRNKRIMIAYDLARILCYIHKKNIGLVHGDISPNNIMISREDEVFLIDFGSSFSELIVKKAKSYYGTKGYFSPKIIENPMAVNRGIDIYSFAMILKLLEIDKTSIEGYELYIKCIDKSENGNFDIEEIMDELLQILI